MRAEYCDEGYNPFGSDVWGHSTAGLDHEGLEIYDFDLEGYDGDGLEYSGFGAHPGALEISGFVLIRKLKRWNHTQEDPLSIGQRPYDKLGRDVFVRSGATCAACRWDSNIFHRHCRHCGVRLCRACDGSAEAIRRRFRERYLWPGADSFGIDALFEGADQVEKHTEEEERVQRHKEEDNEHAE